MELTKEFFEKLGFDVSELPYTKPCVGGEIRIYKNSIRDGSGRFDGYIIEKPHLFKCKTEEEFIKIVTTHV